VSGIVKATNHGRHVVHAMSKAGKPVCGGGNGAKKADWQEDLGEPNCDRCLLILATKTILLCPFCGGKPKFDFIPEETARPEIDHAYYSLGCRSSNACPAFPMVFGDTKLEAIANWNTRKGGAR
jgi:hypothetical protein